MKAIKLILSLVSVLVVLSAAICAVVVFQEELMKLVQTSKDCCKKLISRKEAEDEFEDFADV